MKAEIYNKQPSMESLRTNFERIISHITRSGSPLYEMATKPNNVIDYREDYFNASYIPPAGYQSSQNMNRHIRYITFHHVPGSMRLLIVDSIGVNYLIEKPPTGHQVQFYFISITYIDYFKQVVYLTFNTPINGEILGNLFGIYVTKEHRAVPRPHIREYNPRCITIGSYLQPSNVNTSTLCVRRYITYKVLSIKLLFELVYIYVPQLITIEFHVETTFGFGEPSDDHHSITKTHGYTDGGERISHYSRIPDNSVDKLGEHSRDIEQYNTPQFVSAEDILIDIYNNLSTIMNQQPY